MVNHQTEALSKQNYLITVHVKCSHKLLLNLKEFEKDAIILIRAYRTNAHSNLYRHDQFLCCQEQSIIFWLRYGKSTSIIIENAFQLCKTPKYTSKCYRTIKFTECVKISLHKFCSLLAITSWHSISLFNGPGKTFNLFKLSENSFQCNK